MMAQNRDRQSALLLQEDLKQVAQGLLGIQQNYEPIYQVDFEFGHCYIELYINDILAYKNYGKGGSSSFTINPYPSKIGRASCRERV